MATVNGTSGNDLINQSFVDIDGDSVSNAADTVFGDDGDDSIFGLGGNDILLGELGNDRLFGGTGNDQLFGALGNDILDGGEGGIELLNGGAGIDLVTYESFSMFVEVNLATGLGSFGASGDTLVDIENLTVAISFCDGGMAN